MVEPSFADGLGFSEAGGSGLHKEKNSDVGPLSLVLGEFHNFAEELILFFRPGIIPSLSGAEVEIIAENGGFIKEGGYQIPVFKIL